tara:strand:- start:4991 stop:6088 length:1098 start_codon:yes stop_codon:yes gene_type:complete
MPGCTDPLACNFNINAQEDDGSCVYSDEWPCNYQPTSNVIVEPVLGFPLPNNSFENPLTEAGINLGRHLFYDPILSSDNTVSCASCHKQEYAFGDKTQFSPGVGGVLSNRNTPAMLNLIFHEQSFDWDGKSISLESQASRPIFNQHELNNSDWCEVISRLSNSPFYQDLFCAAFGVEKIDSSHVLNALAQFERTINSTNSKFDQFLRGQYTLSMSESNGLSIYNSEKGDCFHCHPLYLTTDNQFRNNGIDSVFTDLGRFNITNNINDRGLFKTPTLRNIEYSAPYMHDGRFNTIDEVIEHYNSGGFDSPTVDPLMKYIYTNPYNIPNERGLYLTDQEKSDLKAFLLTLSDESFITNPNLSNPFNQ